MQKTKNKENLERSQRIKGLIYRRTRVRMIADFLSDAVQAREYSEVFKFWEKTPDMNSIASKI